ncbi:fimbrillin family protein [Phocaeicola plebeius]|uniref:fimbrillin family protein n=1 Tax=Phocaeicola plebeius TaxID=310297 RepID=UPI0021ABFEED|nr:fimbrillin family protein [Phocaeicola plebeius]MCR8882357.1 fimbrillin family protein [Phocaeicola plebeius]MDM8285712.1 fimbrillin family protein [Phocaeicola plebeius]
MKTMKFYTGLSLFAALLLFSGCGKELDELPAGGSGTESPENPAQTEGELLRLRVSDAGYLDADAGSRATDSGLTTTFEDGDEIGLFVVNNENKVLYANVPYTKSGEKWTAEQKVRTKGYPVRVFAYYPYVKDAEITGKVDVTAQDASAFFQTYIEDLDISNQSTLADYRQADVMACMVEIDDAEAARKELTLKMNHLMGLVVVKLPTKVTLSSVKYYLKGDEDFTWTVEGDVTLPANLSGESLKVTGGIQPLKEETGYRYLCKSGENNISFSGVFKTYGATKSYSVSNATVSSGSSKTYNVSVTSFAAPGKAEYTPQPGNFYMKDGSVLSSVTSSNKADCIGIVYWVPTATDPLEIHEATWLEEYSNCTHGLVVGLEVKQSSWGTYGETTDITDSDTDGIFRGYFNTQRLANERSSYAIVSAYKSLKSGVTLPSGKTSGWYVPSVGELKKLRQAINQVNNSLSTLGSTTLSSSTYWSSGEYSPHSAWTVGMNTGRASTPLKSADRYYVRLSFAF